MKLQQLRFLDQVVACNYNVSAAAKALHTSQSGVSHQIRLLEEELGVEIFHRRERRLLGLTDVGEEIAARARDLLLRARELKTIAADYDQGTPGELTVATTHVHARYALLPVVEAFARRHPRTALRLIQTFPDEIFELLDSDRADIGLTTEPPPQGRFEAIPTYTIGRCVITPRDHPLLKVKRPALAAIARYPMILYDSRLSSGRTVINAFARSGIAMNVVLSAVDVDVIKAYVAKGIGVAIVPSLAYEKKVDQGLRSVPLDHVLPPVRTLILTRRGKYVRRPARGFIELLAALASQK